MAPALPRGNPGAPRAPSLGGAGGAPAELRVPPPPHSPAARSGAVAFCVAAACGAPRSAAQRPLTSGPAGSPRWSEPKLPVQAPPLPPGSTASHKGWRRAEGRPRGLGELLSGEGPRGWARLSGARALTRPSLCPSVPACERCRAVRGSESPSALSPGALRIAGGAPSVPPSPSALMDGFTTISPHGRAGLTRSSPPAPGHGGRKKGLRWAAEPFCAPSPEGRPLGVGCGLLGAASAPGITNGRQPGAGGEECPSTEPRVQRGCAEREMVPAAPTGSRRLRLQEGVSH